MSFSTAESTREVDNRRDREEDGSYSDEPPKTASNLQSSYSSEDRKYYYGTHSSRFEKTENREDYDRSMKGNKRSRRSTSPDNEDDASHNKRARHSSEGLPNFESHLEASIKPSKEAKDTSSSSSMTESSGRSRSPRHFSNKHKKHARGHSRERYYESVLEHSEPKRTEYRDSSSRKRSIEPRNEKDRKSPHTDSLPSSSSSSHQEAGFKIPKKKRKVEDEKEDHKPKPKISDSLLREIRNLLRTEYHHVERRFDDSNGDADDVIWCYAYLDPKVRGHITGGRAHLHHHCRVCKRTCLHLLGTYGTGSRKCLACASEEYGWREDEVPSWYFHDTCKYCENDPKRRGGGGYRGSWNRSSWNRNSYRRY